MTKLELITKIQELDYTWKTSALWRLSKARLEKLLQDIEYAKAQKEEKAC